MDFSSIFLLNIFKIFINKIIKHKFIVKYQTKIVKSSCFLRLLTYKLKKQVAATNDSKMYALYLLIFTQNDDYYYYEGFSKFQRPIIIIS